MTTAVLGPAQTPPRVAYAVARPVGNAVARNRVRRQLRAIVREHASELRGGRGYLFRADTRAASATYGELRDTVGDLVRRVNREERG